MKPTTKNRLKKAIYVAVFLVLIGLFEWYGLIGFLLLFIAMTLWRLWNGREMFKLAMSDIETRIFGKPLQKEYWAKGELKNTKFKFVWRKKDEPKTVDK